MRIQSISAAFLIASLPLTSSAIPSMPKASTGAPSNTEMNPHEETHVLPLSTAAETASLQRLSTSTPHNQNEIARNIASKGELGQLILLRFVSTRPIYLSHALSYLDMDREDVLATLESLVRSPRPEWGHDLHRFIARQPPGTLKRILRQQADGAIAPYHVQVIFEYAGNAGIDALNQALGEPSTQDVSLEVIASAQKVQLIPRVAHLLHDRNTDDHLKIKCLRTLENFKHPAVNRAIDAALEDESHAVINQALLSIAKNGKTRQHETLRKMLDNGDLNKSYVIRALGVSLDPVSVKELETAFITGTPAEKYAVLEAMSTSTHKAAVRLLVTASMESNTGIGAKARALLTR